MNLGKQIKRIRRFLRDPEGNIWSRALLINLYNDAQREIEIKTGYNEDVQAVRVPPLYHCSYLFDWEWPYLSSSQTQFYKALRDYQQGDYTICYQWEAHLNNNGDVSDEGVHFTQPWEAFVGESPGDPVRIRFPSNFHTAKLVVYDREPIEYTTKKAIQLQDSSYVTRTGRTQSYYREDTLDNSFVPYPLPTSVDWNDLDETSESADFIYTYEWESSYLSGNGEKITDEDSNENRDYIFAWEISTFSGQDEPGHGMWLFEGIYSIDGMVVSVTGDTTSSGFGSLAYRTGSLDSQDSGVAVDVIEADNNFVLVYDAIPTDLSSDDDISDYPVFLRKYIEQCSLSRAYRVNNDGNIKSLADYWDFRYQVGIEAMKRFMSKRKEDRDYRLVTAGTPSVRTRRHPRLPSTYPAI